MFNMVFRGGGEQVVGFSIDACKLKLFESECQDKTGGQRKHDILLLIE